MFKKILLDWNPGHDAKLLGHVLEFARKAEGDLTVVTTLEQPTKSILGYFSSRGEDLKEMIVDDYNQNLESALEQNGLEKHEVRTELRWGKEFIEAIKMVQEEKSDLLICPTQKEGEPPDSTAMHFLRKCPCPVWIHQGHLWRGAVRILAAVGGSDAADSDTTLDRRILQHAARLSEILRGRLHVLHCWQGYLESIASSSPRFSTPETSKYIEYAREESEERFKSILETVPLPETARQAIVHGDPGTVIPKYAREHRMDIVVMGSVARTGIPGLLIGNTAERIISGLNCSILAIKPEGFVSPVR